MSELASGLDPGVEVVSEKLHSGEDWFDVVAGVRAGDPVALAKLTGLIVSLLYRHGAYRVRSSWEDICQDVLASLVRSVENGTLREPRAFVSFAYRMTRNAFLDFVQRRDRVTSGGRRDERSVREAIENAPEHCLNDANPDLLLDLQRALDVLPARDRAVIEEIYLRGRTYQEVADRFSIPLGTVKRLQTGGLRTLREVLYRGGFHVAALEAATARFAPSESAHGL